MKVVIGPSDLKKEKTKTHTIPISKENKVPYSTGNGTDTGPTDPN